MSEAKSWDVAHITIICLVIIHNYSRYYLRKAFTQPPHLRIIDQNDGCACARHGSVALIYLYLSYRTSLLFYFHHIIRYGLMYDGLCMCDLG